MKPIPKALRSKAGLIFPNTILSMLLLTKWWLALPVDGPDKLYWGFPLPFLGQGFHTSMSFQFFVLEFLADLFVYGAVWAVLFFVAYKIAPVWRMPKQVVGMLWTLASLAVIGFVLLISSSHPVFHLKRPYEWQLLDSGSVFIWQNTPAPDRSQLNQQEP